MSFAFVMVTLCFGTSLAPRLAGFTVPARPTRDKSHGRPLLLVGAVRFYLVRLGRRIVGGACRSYLPQVVACRWDRRSQSPSGSGCLGTGVLALGHEPICFVSLGPVALVLSLRVFFVKNLLSSWYLGVGVALALPLRGYCFGTLVPWFFAPFYRVCGGGAGPGLPGPARLDRSMLQSWYLVLGPGFLVCRLPSVSLPWVGGFVYVSTF